MRTWEVEDRYILIYIYIYTIRDRNYCDEKSEKANRVLASTAN